LEIKMRVGTDVFTWSHDEVVAHIASKMESEKEGKSKMFLDTVAKMGRSFDASSLLGVRTEKELQMLLPKHRNGTFGWKVGIRRYLNPYFYPLPLPLFIHPSPLSHTLSHTHKTAPPLPLLSLIPKAHLEAHAAHTCVAA
jgi:hypothetical protein